MKTMYQSYAPVNGSQINIIDAIFNLHPRNICFRYDSIRNGVGQAARYRATTRLLDTPRQYICVQSVGPISLTWVWLSSQ